MCIAAIAWRAHPDWLLIAAANRDEYHERPAAPLALWDDGSGIVAGRDLRSGGTWLGVSGSRFVLVTNLRGYGEPDLSRKSRGHLVTELLQEGDPPADLEAFNPFNLVAVDAESATFITNRPEPVRSSLPQGIYGLSNGMLDEPWPKTLQLKAAMTDWLAGNAADPPALFAALASERMDNFGLHPRQPSDVPREPPETPVFIRNPVYGTRCSTVAAIGMDGRGTIVERSFTPEGSPSGPDLMFRFRWSIP